MVVWDTHLPNGCVGRQAFPIEAEGRLAEFHRRVHSLGYASHRLVICWSPSNNSAHFVAPIHPQQVTPIAYPRTGRANVVPRSDRASDFVVQSKAASYTSGLLRVRTQHPGAQQRYPPRAAYFLVVLHVISLACAARASDRPVAIYIEYVLPSRSDGHRWSQSASYTIYRRRSIK